VDEESGLVQDAAGVWETTRDRCTECHSAQLLILNRADRDGWARTIRWMEEEEGLEPLGEAEDSILEYLAANYGLKVRRTKLQRRRAPLNQPPLELDPARSGRGDAADDRRGERRRAGAAIAVDVGRGHRDRQDARSARPSGR